MTSTKNMIKALWGYYTGASRQPHILMAADLLVTPETVKRWVFDGRHPVNAGTLERISDLYKEKVGK